MSKEDFMKYAKRRLKQKEYDKRVFNNDVNYIILCGIERVANGKYRRGQR
jgi:hypothetical protein